MPEKHKQLLYNVVTFALLVICLSCFNLSNHSFRILDFNTFRIIGVNGTKNLEMLKYRETAPQNKQANKCLLHFMGESQHVSSVLVITLKF